MSEPNEAINMNIQSHAFMEDDTGQRRSNSGTGLMQTRNLGAPRHMIPSEMRRIEALSNKMWKKKAFECARLIFGIPDDIIDKIKVEHTTTETLYGILRNIYTTDRPYFIKIMREYISGTYTERQGQSTNMETIPKSDIYKLIDIIGVKGRYKFVHDKLGAHNLPRKEIIKDEEPTTELIIHLLQWWWDWKGHAIPGAIAQLEREAEEGGYTESSGGMTAGMFFQNLPNQR